MRESVPIRSLKHVLMVVVGIAAVAVVLVFAGCGSGGSVGGSSPHDRIASICQSSTKGQYDCTCVADKIEASGYDTDTAVDQLQTVINSVNSSGDLALLPQPVLDALSLCRATPS
jgi:hypothetical protein